MHAPAGQNPPRKEPRADRDGEAAGTAVRTTGPSDGVGGRIYRFGEYELNLQRYQLLRGRKHLRLARAPMELLHLLVESQGALLTREAIAGRLWESPGMVDVDQGINTAVRRIRDVLGDDPTRPRYVETVVGRGYRFVASVTVQAMAAAPEETTAVDDGALENLLEDGGLVGEKGAGEGNGNSKEMAVPVEGKGQRGRVAAGFLTGVVLSACLAMLGLRTVLRHRHASLATDRTSEPREVFRPISTNDGEMRVTAEAVSPDGQWVVYADRSGLLLKLLRDNHTEPLRSPPDFRCDQLAWSPGQLLVLASGTTTGGSQEQVWAVSITGKAPKLLMRDANHGVPSPDGWQMLFTRNGNREIWTAAMTGEGSRHLLGNAADAPVTAVFWSDNGRRISLLRGGPKTSRYVSVNALTGATLSEEALPFEGATALRDDRVLLLGASRSAANNTAALWEMQTDAATGAIRRAPRQTVALTPGKAFGLSASEDGEVVGVVLEKGQPDVYTGSLSPRGSALTSRQRLTFDTQADYPHGWLRDNETVVFESNRTGTYQIYRQASREAIAQQITNGSLPAVLPRVTGDGRWILYGEKPQVDPSGGDRLMRVPVGGGSPQPVPVGGPLDDFECSLRATGCVLRVQEAGRAVVFYALNPVRGRGEELARLPWVPMGVGGWSVSPDGTLLALPAVGVPGIRVVRLARESGDRERVVAVSGERFFDERQLGGGWPGLVCNAATRHRQFPAVCDNAREDECTSGDTAQYVGSAFS